MTETDLYYVALSWRPYVQYRCGAKEQAMDLLHDAYVGTVRAMRGGTIRTTPPTYLYGAVRHLKFDHWENRMRRARLDEIDASDDSRHPPDEHANIEAALLGDAEAQQQRAALQQAFAHLTPLEREIWRVTLAGGDPERELGITPTQHRVEKSRGKAKLAMYARRYYDSKRERLVRECRTH